MGSTHVPSVRAGQGSGFWNVRSSGSAGGGFFFWLLLTVKKSSPLPLRAGQGSGFWIEQNFGPPFGRGCGGGGGREYCTVKITWKKSWKQKKITLFHFSYCAEDLKNLLVNKYGIKKKKQMLHFSILIWRLVFDSLW